ncbi:MAG TPA: zf-HC2 domain-containing protein [Terriglobia bacterium]|nr:zf-HC2 domain-containing protein [Terriglobia bacterium]
MTNCEWLNSKLEAYFCDDLADPELQRFQQHVETCADCRDEVESLTQIEPMMRGVLQHRLALALAHGSAHITHTNGRSRTLKLGLAFGSFTAVLILAVLGLKLYQDIPAPPVAVQPPAMEQPLEPVKKDTDPQEIRLSKPLAGSPVKPVPQPHLDTALANGPDFAITDGTYIFTLDDYRGRITFFSVLTPEQQTAMNHLEQLYDQFGSNPKARIFGVPRHREDDFRGTNFPLYFNHGSQLLGVKEGQFILLDASGQPRLRGSLDAASVARIKSELAELGIR